MREAWGYLVSPPATYLSYRNGVRITMMIALQRGIIYSDYNKMLSASADRKKHKRVRCWWKRSPLGRATPVMYVSGLHASKMLILCSRTLVVAC